MASHGVGAWLRPRMWGLHLLGVLALVVTIVAGLWQLGVYDSRQAAERADRQEVPTAPLSEVLGPDDAFGRTANHRPVTVTGTYADADEQFWISDHSDGSRDGYWLVAPLVVADAPATETGRDPALLVVRGWSATNGALPPTPSSPVEVEAVLEAGESSAGGSIDATRTTSAIRIPLLINELPYDLYAAYGIVTAQDPPDTTSLEPVSPPDPDVSWTIGLRNLAYAVQWWVFGAFAVFMWWRMGSEMVAGRREESHDPERTDPDDRRVA